MRLHTASTYTRIWNESGGPCETVKAAAHVRQGVVQAGCGPTSAMNRSVRKYIHGAWCPPQQAVKHATAKQQATGTQWTAANYKSKAPNWRQVAMPASQEAATPLGRLSQLRLLQQRAEHASQPALQVSAVAWRCLGRSAPAQALPRPICASSGAASADLRQLRRCLSRSVPAQAPPAAC